MPKYCMPAPNRPAAAHGLTSLDNAIESPTTALYRAAIGPINHDYYLPIFMRFEATDRVGPSWNWAACLYTLNWMAFRRLWRPAFVYAAALLVTALLVFGLGRFLFGLSDTEEMSLWVLVATLGFVIPGFYGNAWFHAASRKRMGHALAASRTMQEATAMLSQQASSRRHFFRLALVNIALAGLAIGAFVLFTAPPVAQSVTPKTVVGRNVVVGTPEIDAKIALATASLPSASARVSSAPVPNNTIPAQTTLSEINPAASASASASASGAIETAPKIDVFVPRRPLTPTASAATPTAAVAVASATASSSVEMMQKSSPAQKINTSQPKNTHPTDKSLKGKAYLVNVGLFAKESNANNAKNTLVNAGITSYSQELETPKGKRIRVRAGPFDSEADAATTAEKIRTLKLDAVVIAQ